MRAGLSSTYVQFSWVDLTIGDRILLLPDQSLMRMGEKRLSILPLVVWRRVPKLMISLDNLREFLLLIFGGWSKIDEFYSRILF